MSGQDREKRLGTASTLHDAIKSLGKVSEDRRAEFIHDRLMSAIDDICHERLEKKNAAKFTGAQILVLKDIAFQIVYILDQRNQRRVGFFGAMWTEFKKETALKKVGLISGAILTTFAIVAGVYAGYQQASPWWAAKKADKIEMPKASSNVTPSPNLSGALNPTVTPSGSTGTPSSGLVNPSRIAPAR